MDVRLVLGSRGARKDTGGARQATPRTALGSEQGVPATLWSGRPVSMTTDTSTGIWTAPGISTLLLTAGVPSGCPRRLHQLEAL
jgi:hypothetical protein